MNGHLKTQQENNNDNSLTVNNKDGESVKDNNSTDNKNDRNINEDKYCKKTFFLDRLYIECFVLFIIFTLLVEFKRETIPLDHVETLEFYLDRFLSLQSFFYLLVFFIFIFIYGRLRNKLLEIRRLYILSGISYFQTPMFILSVLILLSIPVIYIYHLVIGESFDVAWNSFASFFKNNYSRAIYISFLSIFIYHFYDYFRIDRELSVIRSSGLNNSFSLIQKIVEHRFPDKGVAEIFDRGISKNKKVKILGTIKKHLNGLEKSLENCQNKYGYIVNLYHPDYLPHLSYVYLENSQLRGLNVPPRRVQLLGRKWTKKGLVSEYVVVHNISDIQRGYIEPSNLMTSSATEKPDKLREEQHDTLNKIADKLLESKEFKLFNGETDITHKELVYRMFREISENLPIVKWNQRSLKKRCLVTVAPDGTLLQISIEEERQINV